ncbi:hypothetical protein [[Mycoplasma] collis]|uniref:hypothetical protein n=1 Tax=[Mycoplasma] collis TaxID=2127 RepID=UPI00051C59D5|nr:hypothetical protein [[Mycoplasma] collis]
MNNKFLIESKVFYFKIILLSIYVILLSFWVIEIVVFGTKQFNNLNENEYNNQIENFLKIKIFLFVFNYLIIIFYLINLIISKNKGIGYFFTIIWIFLFLAIFITNLIDKSFLENNWRISLLILFNSIIALIILTLFYFIFKIYQLKQLNKII